MIDDILADSVNHLLGDCCPPQRVRDIEAGASASELWQTILSSGFADALVPESAGGAGLNLRGALPLVLACGRFALPLPLAQTMVVRAFLASAGKPAPQGPVTFARATPDSSTGSIACAAVPYGMTAEWVLVQAAETVFLLPVASANRSATGVHASLEADLQWQVIPDDTLRLVNTADWRELGACLFAAQIAGAMERVFTTTVQYANERVQFGRSIGKFQAIQQQISVMAEHVAASRMAAQLGADSTSWVPAGLAAAVAKSRASEAVPIITSIAHAVHGAMGITAEYDLQLFTRRLHEWRRACGAESYWNARIGAALSAAEESSTLEFMREQVFASH